MGILNETAVREALVLACHRMGSQKAFAQAHGISEQFLSDMIHGRRDISKRIAALVGFKRTSIFLPNATSGSPQPST